MAIDYNPNPANGAIIDAAAGGLGIIPRVTDADDVRGDMVAIGIVALADWVAFIKLQQREGPIVRTGPEATYRDRDQPVSPTAGATVSLTSEADYWYADNPNFGPGTVKLVPDDATADNGMNQRFVGYQVQADEIYEVRRTSGAGTLMLTVTGPGFFEVRFRRLAGSWRLAGYSGSCTFLEGAP